MNQWTPEKRRQLALLGMGTLARQTGAQDAAIELLAKAVALAPENIYHQLDLAEILIDRGRYAEARIHLSQVANLPVVDVMDPAYKERAASLSRKIEGKQDKGD